MVARSVAFNGDFDLQDDYADPVNLIGDGDVLAENHARPGKDGVLRPVHDVGLPLLAVPVVAVAYPLAQWLGATLPPSLLKRARLSASLLFRHFISLLMAVVAGVLAIEMWRMMQLAGVPARSAWRWALLAALSPPLLSLSFLFFTEIPAALIVIVVLRRAMHSTSSVWAWALTGTLIGLLGFIHVRNGPLAAVLVAIVLIRHRLNARSLSAFAIPIIVIAAIRTYIHWRFWGSLLFNDHARLAGLTGLGEMVREATFRTTGILFDQEFGLLALAPIYLLALAGFVRLWRAMPSLARPLLAVVTCGFATIVLPMVNPYGWVGGWSPAARFIVPIVPLLAVALAVAARDVDGWRARCIAVVVGVQIAIDIIIWNEPKVLWENGDGANGIAQLLPALQSLLTWLPSWHGPQPSPWPFAVMVTIWAALTFWMLRANAPARP
jgi:hypothetical protein